MNGRVGCSESTLSAHPSPATSGSVSMSNVQRSSVSLLPTDVTTSTSFCRAPLSIQSANKEDDTGDVMTHFQVCDDSRSSTSVPASRASWCLDLQTRSHPSRTSLGPCSRNDSTARKQFTWRSNETLEQKPLWQAGPPVHRVPGHPWTCSQTPSFHEPRSASWEVLWPGRSSQTDDEQQAQSPAWDRGVVAGETEGALDATAGLVRIQATKKELHSHSIQTLLGFVQTPSVEK